MSFQFACSNVGITDCRAVVRAETKDQLLAAVASHAKLKHDVNLNETLVSYALTTVTER